VPPAAVVEGDGFDVVDVDVDELDEDPHPASTVAATTSPATSGTTPPPANLRIILTAISSSLGPRDVVEELVMPAFPLVQDRTGSGGDAR
jgi:hypothetical protein